jgi:chromosome partitioning protein
MRNVISSTNLDYLDFIRSDNNLVGCEVELVGVQNREKQLLRLINKVKKDYDFILIDCPPSLGLLTLNVLVASNNILIPIQSEFFALESLQETIKLVQENINKDLKILGILITMHTKRLRLAKKVEALLKANFKNKLLKTKISRNIRLAEAPDDGKPAIMYDVDCAGAKNYMELALEIINEKK